MLKMQKEMALATLPFLSWQPRLDASIPRLRCCTCYLSKALKSKANKNIFDGTLQESNPEQAPNPSFRHEELHVNRVSQAALKTLIKRVGFSYKE